MNILIKHIGDNMKNKMTIAELERIENLFSDIMMARDTLSSLGYDIGHYSLNSVSTAKMSFNFPEMEDCTDWNEVA